MDRPVTILCLASFFKGKRFMEAAHRSGARVLLLTIERLKDAPWPNEAIHERFLMPDIHRQPDVLNAVAFLARTRRIDRIVGLDEYDTVTAAQIREHLRIPGFGESTGRRFRDKLAMRVQARDAGLPVPAFVHVLNHDELARFMAEVPGPWLLKPRTEASAMGIRRIDSPEQLWPILDALGDRQSHFLIESFVAGDVYHVDSIVDHGEVIFQTASRYGSPPLQVYQGGGVFVTQTVPTGSDVSGALATANADLLSAFGMVRGATHAEFIRSSDDGRLYFLEVAARVGGANIDLLVEYATGINLWEEWARVEIADVEGRKASIEEKRDGNAGLIVCLAKDEFPDMSAFNDPEIAWRLHKKNHAGLIVSSDDPDRVDSLIADYSKRFARDFLAVAPPLSSADDMGDVE